MTKDREEIDQLRIANVDLAIKVGRLRAELQWIADTPMQWTKPQSDIYWSNVAMAMAKKATDALAND